MLFVRVYFDDVYEQCGAMQFLRKEFADRRVPLSEIAEIMKNMDYQVKNGNKSDILVLKMLKIHGSDPAHQDNARRVLPLDFVWTKNDPAT